MVLSEQKRQMMKRQQKRRELFSMAWGLFAVLVVAASVARWTNPQGAAKTAPRSALVTLTPATNTTTTAPAPTDPTESMQVASQP